MSFVYLFRKYPVLRFGIYAGAFFIALGITVFILMHVNDNPSITYIDPSVGVPGDVLLIKGKHFGESNNTSYVEIAGSRMTGASYIEWSDTEILVLLPYTVEDGLVYVVKESGRSKPRIFSHKAHIPVKMPTNPQHGLPAVHEIKQKKSSIGSLITIIGKNFGSSRNTSHVLFSAQDDKSSRVISSDENKFEYDFWSDQEIRVRVPDGAVSGSVTVLTDRGRSNGLMIDIGSSIGSKLYSDKREYIVVLSMDMRDIVASAQNSFFVRMPKPPVSAAQTEVRFTESVLTPQPLFTDFMNTVLYQFDNLALDEVKKIDLSYIISRYAIQSNIQAAQVKPFSDTKHPVYVAHTKPSVLVPSDNEALVKLAVSIIGREKNPYLQAKAIYNWLISKMTLLTELRSLDANPIECLSLMQADAYDMSILFTALCRAVQIPTVPISGILIDKNQQVRVHWWSEFYIEHFGWIPVDVSLAAGLPYEPFQDRGNGVNYYFGNLDSQHIMFSRDWNVQKPMVPKSKTVYRARTYAFQSIWEETIGDLQQYSSYWSDPNVISISK